MLHRKRVFHKPVVACMKPKPPTVFWGNERVNHAMIIEEGRVETCLRLAGHEQVLLVQDSVSFDFSHHPATAGLGHLENAHRRGFLAHTSLAVSVSGLPLGVMAQQAWSRDSAEMGQRDARHERGFEEKESYKWVAALPETGQLPVGVQPIIVGDAEAHIYELLAVLDEKGLDYVIRAADYRGFTEEGQGLFAAIAQQVVQSRYRLSLKRRPDREARETELDLRFGLLHLRRPRRAESAQETLAVYVVDVQEVAPPDGEKAIHWVLLTTCPVESVAQAQQILLWYSYRWLIERLHYTLKSGCKIEASQLRAEIRLERLLALYTLVAWRLLWLTYQARVTPEAPCTVALQPAEWQALFLFTQRHQRLPDTPPSLRQAVRWIAQLGGFLGRKGDGEPGVKVIWRGWSRLQDITQTFTLLRPPNDVGNA